MEDMKRLIEMYMGNLTKKKEKLPKIDIDVYRKG